MIRFIQFLFEFRDPHLKIDHGPAWQKKPLEDRPLSIFTKTAGYGRDWSKGTPREYNPNHDALVHTTSHFPIGGMIQTRGHAERDQPFKVDAPKVGRETIHFTRNGLVTSHGQGWFVDQPFTIIAPQAGLRDRLVTAGDHDSMIVGNAHLPHGSRIIMHDKFMTDEHRKHVADLLGVKTWDEASKKMASGDSYVNFGKNQVKLVKANSSKPMHHAVHSELRRLGITPIQVGMEGPRKYQNDSKNPGAVPPKISPLTGRTDYPENIFQDIGHLRRQATQAPWPH